MRRENYFRLTQARIKGMCETFKFTCELKRGSPTYERCFSATFTHKDKYGKRDRQFLGRSARELFEQVAAFHAGLYTMQDMMEVPQDEV